MSSAYSYQAVASPLSLLGDFKARKSIAANRWRSYTELHKAASRTTAISTFELAVAILRMANMQEQLKEYPAALENARKAVALYEELVRPQSG